MITLQNYPLILPDHEGVLMKWINENINPISYIPWLRREFPGLAYTWVTWPTGIRQERPVKLNRFYWPTGASRWAYGHFIVDADNLDQIQKKAYGEGGLENNKIKFVMDSPQAGNEKTETFACDVYLLPPTQLASMPLKDETVNNLYLITIVDERYYWWYKATDDMYGDKKITDTTTWTDLFGFVNEYLGIEIKVDEIDPKFLNPSPQLNLSYQVIPPFLDAICFNVGHRFVAQPIGGYETQSFSTAVARRRLDISNNPERTLRAGGRRFKNEIIKRG